MKSTPKFIGTLALSAALFIGAAEAAQVSYQEPSWVIAVPMEGARASDIHAAIRALSIRPEVLETVSTFDTGETNALRKIGGTALAASKKLRTRTASDLEILQAYVKNAKLPLTLEPAHMEFGLEADLPIQKVFNAPERLAALQWGVQNLGQSQRLDIDDLTSIQVPGIANEDIGVNRAAGEPMVNKNKITVAILDTGIDLNHPDLKNQIARNETECAKQAEYLACQRANPTNAATCDTQFLSLDTDGNGYPLDCAGWNVATNSVNRATGIWGNPNTADELGHGSHVAGIVGAALSRLGTRGVMQNVRLLPVKVIQSSPNSPVRPQSADPTPLPSVPAPAEGTLRWAAGFTDLIARGMLYSIRSGANVVNMSMAWPAGADSPMMRQMVRLAQDRGILIVASAGNDSADARVLPCQYPGVICVAAHGPDGVYSHFSNYGPFVDLAAPGLRILSTWPIDRRQISFHAYTGYEYKNGTSMAAPFVAGMTARLLAEGFSPREIYARLLVGARDSKPAVLADTAATKTTRSGNADLPGALNAKPQPLILPAEKTVTKITWDRVTSEIPLTLQLKNFWEPASLTEIQATLVSDLGMNVGAELTTSNFQIADWEADGVRTLSTAMKIGRADVEGRLSVEFTVLSDGSKPRKFRMPVEISVLVSPTTLPNDAQVLRLSGSAIPRGATLRTVTSVDGKPGLDYIATIVGLQSSLQTIIEQRDGTYLVSAPAAFTPPMGELLQIQRLDLNLDGSSDFVLLYRLPPPQPGALPLFRFVAVDASGALTLQFDYDNEKSAIPDRFQWMKVGKRLVPAWIGLGLTPPKEKPAFDPWNPNPSDEPAIRLYYLDRTDAGSELRSVKVGDLFPIDLLASTVQQKIAGEIPVLFSEGDTFVQRYSVAQVIEGKIASRSPITLPRYQMLIGLRDKNDITMLAKTDARSGTAYASAGVRGSIRVSSIFSTPKDAPIDFTQFTSQLTSSLIRSTAYFAGSRPFAVSQSQYDLVFTDLNSGVQSSTSLDRFSFLPAFITRKIFYPVVAENGAEERTPGILIPASLGSTDSAEIIVPALDLKGHMTGLTRPARFRLSTRTGCDALANPIPATASAPTQLAFYCGDRMVRVPLAF